MAKIKTSDFQCASTDAHCQELLTLLKADAITTGTNSDEILLPKPPFCETAHCSFCSFSLQSSCPKPPTKGPEDRLNDMQHCTQNYLLYLSPAGFLVSKPKLCNLPFPWDIVSNGELPQSLEAPTYHITLVFKKHQAMGRLVNTFKISMLREYGEPGPLMY